MSVVKEEDQENVAEAIAAAPATGDGNAVANNFPSLMTPVRKYRHWGLFCPEFG